HWVPLETAKAADLAAFYSSSCLGSLDPTPGPPAKWLYPLSKLDRSVAGFFNCSAPKFLRTIRYGINPINHDRLEILDSHKAHDRLEVRHGMVLFLAIVKAAIRMNVETLPALVFKKP